MKEREKIIQIHRIVMNYYHFTTSTTFANEEDEKNYTEDLLNEISSIINNSDRITISKKEYEWLKKCEKDLSGIDFSL